MNEMFSNVGDAGLSAMARTSARFLSSAIPNAHSITAGVATSNGGRPP